MRRGSTTAAAGEIGVPDDEQVKVGEQVHAGPHDSTRDHRILEYAVAAHADIIVTGDRHLLALKQDEGIAIVRPADFRRMVPALD